MVRQQCQVYHTSQNLCPAKKDIKVACVFMVVTSSPSAPGRRIRSWPPNGSRQTSWREGVLAARTGAAVGDAVNVGGGTSRLSAEDSGERDALALSSQGSVAAHAIRRRRRWGALERSWPWGPCVLFFRAHLICDNSRVWQEDGRTTAIEAEG